jgi:predicted DNA-binding protein with PD1-like motif
MRTIATGRMGRVVYARLAPGDDLYKAIIEIAQQEQIKTGLVLDITGAATNLRVSLPKDATDGTRPPKVLEVEGLAEIMGSGIIGQVKGDFLSADGEVRYTKNEPYAHIHVSATVNGQTYTGHLVEGTLVRSVIPQSHFTIALAEVEGVDFFLNVDETSSQDYPAGVPYHELKARPESEGDA